MAGIKNVLDPRKSPLLYFLAFFLSVPALVYGVVGKSTFETGEAATIGDWIEITAPAEGQKFLRGDTVEIRVRGYAVQSSMIPVTVNGSEVPCGSSPDSTIGSFSKICSWNASYVGTMTARAAIVPSSPGVSTLIDDTVTFYVISDTISYTWANPLGGDTVSGSVQLRWAAGGFLDQSELSATRYEIYLDSTSPVGANASGGTLVASGNLGTGGICRWTDHDGLWSCVHPSAWSTLDIPNGAHTLTGVLTKTGIGGGATTQSTISINVNNVDNPPVCEAITLSASEIYSGDSVTITAKGADPDGTPITRGRINYGNGQSSSVLSASGESVSVTYSGYAVASGSAQYEIKARFESNGVWGEYGCSKFITVRARSSGNTCPVITSTPITSVRVGSTYSYTLRYVDEDQVTLKALLKPGWLSWNASSGTLAGVPSAQHVGYHSVALKVDDGDPACNVQQSFTIRVLPAGQDGEDGDDDEGDIWASEQQAPNVVVTSPYAGAKFFCGSSTIAWYATDDGNIEEIWIEYSSDGDEWIAIVDGLAGSETNYDWDVCEIPFGDYFVRVWARDDDGNERAGLSGQFEIISAGDVSESPKIVNPQPKDNETVTSTKPTISAEFVPGNADISVDSVQIKVDGKDITAYAETTGDGFTYLPVDELALGEHTVYVTIGDVDGKSSEKEWKFTVSTSVECTFNFLGLTLPCWVLYALLVCGALLLLLIIVVAVARLVKLAKEDREGGEDSNDADLTGGSDLGGGDGGSWSPESSEPEMSIEPTRSVPPRERSYPSVDYKQTVPTK